MDARLQAAGLAIQDSPVREEVLCGQAFSSNFDIKTLSLAAAHRRLQEEQHWQPLLIQGDAGRLLFGRVQAPLNQQPFFYLSLLKRIPEFTHQDLFYAPLELLHQPLANAPPAGLIFHMSRCGSTLLGRAVETLANTQVVFEGPMSSWGLWQWLSDNWQNRHCNAEAAVKVLRNLAALSVMATPEACYFKMASWNVLFSELLLQAFPDSPALFLYRRPLDVFLSVVKTPSDAYGAEHRSAAGQLLTGLGDMDFAQLDRAQYHRKIYQQMLATAVAELRFNILNYADLNATTIRTVLQRGLGRSVSDNDLPALQRVFGVYSKSALDQRRAFSGDQQIDTPNWLEDWLDELLLPDWQELQKSSRRI